MTEIINLDMEEINIATQGEISIGDLTQELISMINPKAKINTDNLRLRPDKSEVERLLGSNEKIKKLTNWKQAYNFKDGLKNTVKWFEDANNLKHYKPKLYNV